MINLSTLKKGNIIKILVDNNFIGLKAGDTLTVINSGYSKWDQSNYIDCKTNNGHIIEIMNNYKDFVLVC